MTLASFRILGLPAPQGSKSFKGMVEGKRGQQIPRLVESWKQLPKWRKEVTKQAALAWRGKPPLDQPLRSATFRIVMPARPCSTINCQTASINSSRRCRWSTTLGM